MRSMTFGVLMLMTVATLTPGTAAADERWVFGLDTRFGDDVVGGWSILPNFSYYLSPRLRLDGFLGVGYANSDQYSLHVSPGFRYYLRPGPERWRLSTGFQLGFELVGEHDDADRFAPIDGVVPEIPDHLRDRLDGDFVTLRIVPVELEYWLGPRMALAFGIDYQARAYEGLDFEEDDGLGLVIGFRTRLK